jgi:CRP-like cAMP-binding protein
MATATAIKTTLAAGAWFAGLPVAIQTALLDAGKVRQVPTGKTLFEQDGAPSGLHAVLEGEIHVIGLSTSGNEVIIAISRPADWLGFLTCLDGQPHAYTGVATQKSRIFSLPASAVAAIFEQDVATYKLLQMPELRAARKMSRFVVEDMGFPLIQRVAGRLVDLGRWGYGPAAGPVASLNHVSQEVLAMSVHASRQKINVILRDFESRGWIEQGYGRLHAINVPALEIFSRSGSE